ncbi:Rne/Rng family ribonuclease [Pleomorphomonas carboxyditropha]|uniref:Ribonuclease E n=1 Tax=Pleomorphomonas carboxyditropha TaxID=2023338 RepID=A0A2G9WSN2_9HYPH|nr:ribonuclease E/G [Pleomorphomonas carboxyditropha]PIO97713.1 ribonuclease E/G [Pleomorphomonas carboxyditropha]
MANKMLIDATHPEETRVVVVRGHRVEEFDFESATRKQLRGNIYLAKVTRVEPSLQAAFVEYGGNRHGFLAFSEIHPDYYQIPQADRQALIEAEEAEEREEAERRTRVHRERQARAQAAKAAARPAETVSEAPVDDGEPRPADDASLVEATPIIESGDDEVPVPETGGIIDIHDDQTVETINDDGEERSGDDEEEHVESVGAEDALEEVPERRVRRARQYRIQEVIKRRQVLLVQVVKEERGTKGAALTTYLSLAGRYSVLMPNSGRGGGISRKITNVQDRKRLKEIAHELDVPEGMGVILRTAGAARTKTEIKRDFEYLLRLWENVRELTLRSSAPSLVYEEGSLVKRSIRDLYNKDIDEVLVAGEDSYREAKDFMRMLMPSHAKNVQPYRDPIPVFGRFGVEPQLDAMFSPQVTLKSGGYLVINQTEALVAIDVNSGRSTREHNIEDTALATNLEAAEEVARQLRLRDLAGLIVIDFIDMEEAKNNKAVERKLKDCLKNDRARIQVGRISHFGLMEMSRQRIRTGVLEGSTELCPHCLGAGIVRSTESVALHVLRSLEDLLIKGVTHHLTVRTRSAVALYILNQKRKHLSDLEARFGLTITIAADEHLGSQHFAVERGEIILNPAPPPPAPTLTPESVQPYDEEIDEDVEEEDDEEEEAEKAQSSREERGDGDNRRKRRRRRRRRTEGGEAVANGEGQDAAAEGGEQPAAEGDEGDEEGSDEDGEERAESEGDSEQRRRSRRRGRRGGRRRHQLEEDIGSESIVVAQDNEPVSEDDSEAAPVDEEPAADAGDAGAAVAAPSVADDKPIETLAEEAEEAEEAPEETAEAAAPVHAPLESVAELVEKSVEANEPAQQPEPEPEPEPDSNHPKKTGWWQRRSFF